MHAELEAVWQRVVEGWDEPARHDALIALVTQKGEWAWAATRYKEKAGDAIADRQLERIRKAATATMFASASHKRTEDSPYKRTIVIFVVLVVMLVIALVGVKLLHDTHVEDTSPRAPATTPRAK